MSALDIHIAVRRCAVLGLVAVLTTAAAPAMSQTNAVNYPPSRALRDVAAWLQGETPLGPSQVVDINPAAVTAVTSANPMRERRGFLATVSSEATDPQIVDQDGVASWSIPVEVDCETRRLRLGAMTGYGSRDLHSDPRVLRQADSDWMNPPPNAPLDAVVRGLCDRDFHRPLMGQNKPVQPKSREPIRSTRAADAPQLDLRPALSPTPVPTAEPRTAAVSGTVAVQIGASSSLPDIQALLTRFKGRFAGDLAGRTTNVATVQLDGKTVHRALISGFGSTAEANAFCKTLAAAGQACFVRR